VECATPVPILVLSEVEENLRKISAAPHMVVLDDTLEAISQRRSGTLAHSSSSEQMVSKFQELQSLEQHGTETEPVAHSLLGDGMAGERWVCVSRTCADVRNSAVSSVFIGIGAIWWPQRAITRRGPEALLGHVHASQMVTAPRIVRIKQATSKNGEQQVKVGPKENTPTWFVCVKAETGV